MKLSRVVISGFKTFARRGEIILDDRITAVVGPNGSGKSNLVDAIRWALGETNARELRGVRMDEVIYAGGNGRGRMGLAEVELVLDNQERRLPREDAEVSVSRRVARGADSEFRLNGDRVRLRDLHRVLAPTGLTQHGYAVVAQHDIDGIIQATPAQRRSLVEQAAGVRSLQAATDDALERIGRAEITLSRLEDFLGEAGPRLEELRLQSEAALEQRSLSARLGELRGSLAREEWRAARGRLRQARRRLAAAEARAEVVREAEAGFTAQLQAQRQLVADGRGRQRVAAERLESARLAAERAAGDARRWSERCTLGAVQRAQAAAQLASAVAEAERARDLLAELETAAAEPEPAEGDSARHLEARRQEHAAARDRLAAAEARRTAAETSLGEAVGVRAAAVSAQREALSRLAVLEESLVSLDRQAADARARIESVLAGGEDPTAAVAAAVRDGRLAGVRLRSCLTVRDPADALAIEAALEEHLDGWLVDDPEAAGAVLDPAGSREELLPANPPPPEPALALRPGARTALSAIEVTVPSAATALAARLHGIWLVDDAPAARAMVLATGGTVVTPDGTVFTPSWIRGGGPPGRERKLAAQPDRDRLAAIEASRQERLASRPAHEAAAAEAAAERSAAEAAFEEARLRAEAARLQPARVRQEVDDLAARLRDAEAQAAAGRLAAEDRARRLGAARGTVAAALARVESVELRLAAVEGEVIAALARSRVALRAVGSAGDAVWSAQGEVERAAPSQAGAERRLLELEAERSEVAVGRARADDEVLAAGREAAAAGAAVDELAEVVRGDDEDEGPEPDAQAAERAEREIVRLERRVAALGPVNALAPEQLEALEGRYSAVSGNRDDLRGACSHIHQLAAHLRRECELRFETVFHEVSGHFHALFAELFPGGRATLRLTAPPEEAGEEGGGSPGVEILAQPPGKRLQPLSLLSGGERALTALAVILALQQVSASPFYVFDEVDAALDDANVTRFSRLLRRLSGRQQFIIVTHNHITMAAAHALYGVTIDGEGVSSILSTRLAAREEPAASRSGRDDAVAAGV